MDGVLLDSEPLHFEVARRIFALDGFTYTHELNREFIGSTTDHVMATLVERHRLPRTAADYCAAYDVAIVEVMREPREPADGVRWLLSELAARGVRVGLASSSWRRWIDATLAGLGLTDTFPVAVGGDMVPHGKPAPDVYLEAARQLGVPPSACIAIEDSGTGLAAALAAGMKGVGLITPHIDPDRLSAAHKVIRTLRDFPLDWIS